jgi:hypothetical protein
MEALVTAMLVAALLALVAGLAENQLVLKAQPVPMVRRRRRS